MSCNGCGNCGGYCCPDEQGIEIEICPCCTRTLVDILQALIDQFPFQSIGRIFLPGPAGQIVNSIPIQIRNNYLLEVLQGANQRIVNICDIVALEGATVNAVNLSAIPPQENCGCCEESLTELMTAIAAVPGTSFDLNTQSQQAGSIQASNPSEVFDGVVRVTSGNNKSIVSLCHVSSVDRIVPPLV